MKSVFIGLVAVVLLLTGMPSLAQGEVLFNGGITEEEREQAPAGGVKLVFFIDAGNYLADMQVDVSNNDGAAVLSVRSQGPWLVLDLPAGTYNVVVARRNGDVQSQRLTLDGSPAEIGFMFPGP